MRQRSFTVEKFTSPKGLPRYRLQGWDGDQRIRKTFKTRAEALGEKQRLELEAENLDPADGLKRTSLTDDQLKDAANALANLQHGSLLDAVLHWEKHGKHQVESVPLHDAIERFLTYKRTRKRTLRERTLNSLRIALAELERTAGAETMVDEIQSPTLAALVESKPAARTALNCYRRLSNFFNWSTKEGYCSRNPIDTVERPEVEEPEPKILSVADCQRLMTAAVEYRDGRIAPNLALRLFAGLRTDEANRITWDDIDLTARLIAVRRDVSKTRQKRVIEIEDNLLSWLQAYEGKPLDAPRLDFQAVRTAAAESASATTRASNGNASLHSWHQDCLRHSAISYHVARYQNVGKTALWAGNSASVLQRHYLDIAEAISGHQQFWKINRD